MFNVGSQGYRYQLRQQCRQTVAKHKELNKNENSKEPGNINYRNNNHPSNPLD